MRLLWTKLLIGITGGLLSLSIAPDATAKYSGAPVLADRVAAGQLEPVAKRLPKTPRVMESGISARTIGTYGGDLLTLIRKEKDVKLLCIYGYARLVGFNEALDLVPDILESYDVKDGRIFTFTLRDGHRWSDGTPFTSEDLRFWWEDVALNKELNPAGPNSALIINGELPTFEVLDERTVRYSWSTPNPDILPRLAGASPLFIYGPSRYLKQFHKDYADPKTLEALVVASNRKNWAELYDSKDNLYFSRDPDLPTLQPWVNTTTPPSERYVAVRNPYFHRVDETGQQLPYIDRFIFSVVKSWLIPVKAGTGETDLQARGLSMTDYVFLKGGEKRNDYTTTLWRTTLGSQISLYPNLNAGDAEWRLLLQDVRFRRALSLGINRYEINQVLYYGLAVEGADTVLPESPLYKAEYRSKWAEYDPDKANSLLDDLGLARDGDGKRHLPDGRPMDIVVETSGETPAQVDVLELIADHWRPLGIRLITKPMHRDLLRKRVASGETLMTVWAGLAGAVPTAKLSPVDLTPASRYDFQWPKWGYYYETAGQSGEKATMPEVRHLAHLYQQWRNAGDDQTREMVWHEILQQRADQVYSIGTVAGVGQPVVKRKNLMNVPAEGFYNWQPGAFFGIYGPDRFWFKADN